MKKITLQHAGNTIERVAGSKPVHVLITADNNDISIVMIGRNRELKSTIYWYKALVDVGEQIKIRIDDVDDDSECISRKKENVDDLSLDDMLANSNIKTDKMMGFQLSYRSKLIFVPFRKNRVLSVAVSAVCYADRVELHFGGMDKTDDGQFISKRWLCTESENEEGIISGEEIIVSVLSETDPVEEHNFLPQKN